MKLATFLFSMMMSLGLIAGPSASRTNAILPVAHYDLAEFAFRQCMSSGTNITFHLSYTTNASYLPPEFMSRFLKGFPVVRSVPDGFTTVSNKFVVDRVTNQEAVALAILELRVGDDFAEVLMFRFATFTSSRTRYFLVRDRGSWKVRDKSIEFVACQE